MAARRVPKSLILICILLGVVLLWLLSGSRRAPTATRDSNPQIVDAVAVAAQADSSGNVQDQLRRIDSLDREIDLTRAAIQASRLAMQSLIDSLIAQNRALQAKAGEPTAVVACAVCDSLRLELDTALQYTRQCCAENESASIKVRESMDQLSGVQKELARLQAVHTIQALFVLDAYLNSPVSEKDPELDRVGAKKTVVRYFDVCAVALGWKERYCDVQALVYGVQNAEGFGALRRVAEKQRLTPESLFFLSRLGNPGPWSIERSALKELVIRTFSSFEIHESMGYRNFSHGMVTGKFKSYIDEKAGMLKASNAW